VEPTGSSGCTHWKYPVGLAVPESRRAQHFFFFLFGRKKTSQNPKSKPCGGSTPQKELIYIDITIITVQNQNPTNPNKNQSGWLHKNND